MKKIYLAIALVSALLPVQAQTNVTGPTVSGAWTLSGSPYIVKADLTVPAGSKLRIDPGVQVLVDGPYLITVNGSLLANGKEAQRISFRAKDTTGWGNIMVGHGGWRGIHFSPAGSGVDSSIFRYCDVRDIKNAYEYADGICTERSLRIVHCYFTHNRDMAPVWLKSEDPAVSVVVDSCEFYKNRGHAVYGGYVFRAETAGMSYLRNSKIYGTEWNTQPIYIAGGRMTVERCEVYDNPADDRLGRYGGAIFAGWTDELVIRNNKLYRNEGERAGALYIMDVNGPIDIDNNFISNNFAWGAHLCDNGGGAIAIYGTTAPVRIRNNVMANNESTYKGGAINLEGVSAVITNNTMINNVSRNHGKAIYVGTHNGGSLTDTVKLLVKNNIFQSNVSFFATKDIFAEKRTRIVFDHNFTNSPVSAMIGGTYGFVSIAGDTTHNIMGSDPGMQSPTITSGMITDATAANFGLKNTSPCVNKGDTALCATLSLDIANRTRIAQGRIDIGAYEFQSGTTGIGTGPQKSEGRLSVYPNPASGQVTLSLSTTGGTLRITDIAGRILWSSAVREKVLSVSLAQFAPGLYYVQWWDGTLKGTTSFVRR
ncbi:T9SS type A sorting domain-containing protein [Taibaiella koreensis]|uniref:T9SS type A sorting domain-containing protein n=1 Tax=Taibaiella koreensis TaxID=1268548 RepID=UPI0013C2EFB1|nr:T9SS type A sorting domain-containing protein [Taibaiella koreensis]